MTYLEDPFGFLKQNQSFFVIFALNEVVRSISQFSQDDRNLILIHLDLLIVHLVERVAFLRSDLIRWLH